MNIIMAQIHDINPSWSFVILSKFRYDFSAFSDNHQCMHNSSVAMFFGTGVGGGGGQDPQMHRPNICIFNAAPFYYLWYGDINKSIQTRRYNIGK